MGGRREGRRGGKGKRALRRLELPGSEPFKTSRLERGHPKLLLYLETQLGSSGNLPVLMNMKIGRRLNSTPGPPPPPTPPPSSPHLPGQGASRPRLDRQLHFRQMPAGTRPRHSETLSPRQWTGISEELGEIARQLTFHSPRSAPSGATRPAPGPHPAPTPATHYQKDLEAS